MRILEQHSVLEEEDGLSSHGRLRELVVLLSLYRGFGSGASG